MLLFSAISTLLLVYLFWGGIYQAIFSLAGFAYRGAAKPTVHTGVSPFIRVFIPCYREDGVILGTVRRALAQDYPSNRFEIVVIADGLTPATLQRLSGMPVVVIPVAFEKSTKSRALNAALQAFECAAYPADLAVVLDSDNLMEPGFLRIMAEQFQSGRNAIQGCRAAKNMQTPLAVLDAASEEINNHILCRGHRALGLPARLAGSGMAFDYALFASVMPNIDAVGGFDKELELRLTRAGVSLEYAEKAVVLDEKVSRANAFSTQRSRWIAAQFKYARRFLPAGIKALFSEGNLPFFIKALQMTLPPRLLGPGLAALGFVLQLLLGTGQAGCWAGVTVLHVAALALALPGWFFKGKQLKSLLHLPLAFGATLSAMLQLKQAGKNFVVTPKMVTTH